MASLEAVRSSLLEGRPHVPLGSQGPARTGTRPWGPSPQVGLFQMGPRTYGMSGDRPRTLCLAASSGSLHFLGAPPALAVEGAAGR